MNKRLKQAVCILVCLTMAVLTGCQFTVGGSDIQTIVNNTVNRTSYQGSGNLTIQFNSDPASTTSYKIGGFDYAQLGTINLQMTSIKMPSPDLTTLTGQLTIMNRQIPIKMTMDQAQLAIQIENSSIPVVFHVNKMLSKAIPVPSFPGIDTVLSNILNKPSQVIQALLPYLVKELPTPPNVVVSSANQTINGESVDLQQIHMALTNSEMLDFYKGLLQNLIADPAGMKALLTQIYQATFETATTQSATGGFDIIGAIIGQAVNGIVQQLQKTLANLNNPPVGTSAPTSIIDANSSFQADLYTDNSEQLRQINLVLNLGGIKLTLDEQLWNVNQAIVPDEPVAIPANALQWGDNTTIIHLLKTLDVNSQAYQLLKNDLHVTRKNIRMVVYPLGQNGAIAAGSPFVNKAGRTMVPVRYVSENLAANVDWNKTTQKVTVTDILTGKTIVLTINQSQVSVDGTAAALDSPAVLVNGSTYVPLSFIARTLGGIVGYENATHTVTIDKN